MKFFQLIVFIGLTNFSIGQGLSLEKKQKLDSLFNELDKNKMSMANVSIYFAGNEVYNKNYGISNIIKGSTISSKKDTTLYRIGSLTKIFTAYLVMKSVEEGKITLTQNLETFFPELINAQNISIENLLSHTSLLPIYHKVNDLERLRKVKNEKELIEVINKRESNLDTLKMKYNNLNYILLGLIIEKIYHKSYSDVLNSNLLSLNMPKVYGSTRLLNYLKNEANSFHIEKEKWVEDFENRECPISDGSGFLISNATTINDFMYGLFNNKLLSKELLQKMFPTTTIFGYGLMKTNFKKHKGYGHTGRIEGFTSATTYFPEEKINVTLLQNGTVYPMNDILLVIGSILFDEAVIIPNFKKVELTEAEIINLLGTYNNDEEGYKVIVDKHKDMIRLRVAKGESFFNKMILSVYALDKTTIFNPTQGIIFEFSKHDNGKYNLCEMKVNGAKLPLVRNNN
jgi:D-alanyl-D-alanine carboxypeptidase